MIRRFGRAGARARAMRKRREIAAEAHEDTGRLVGRCALCDGTHGFPDLRSTCPRCGVEGCFVGRCACGVAR